MTDGMFVSFESHLPEAMSKMWGVAKDRMMEATNEVRNETLGILSGSRHGRTYKVPGTGRTYTASSPGEPPAQRIGELRQSIKTSIEGEGGNLIGKVGTDKEYGPMLESGTSKMAARPWLRKSFEKSEGRIKAIFGRLWFP
uniref:Putative tail protein n=1 Tax=viral metagenome TaxID=1070528 RepID=A0A6M3IPQ9_9ZZZZ